MKLIILRSNFINQTLSNMLVLDDTDIVFQCKSLELPWQNNEFRVSCIPVGIYQVEKFISPKFGKCFQVLNVPNRDKILIHQANYKSDLLGCMAPGVAHTDINGDGLRDVTSSKPTMERLLSILPQKFELQINNI